MELRRSRASAHLPPDQPLPADQLGRYSPERDYNAEREIADYVETQAHHDDETVQHAERVKVEYVMGIPYEALGRDDRQEFATFLRRNALQYDAGPLRRILADSGSHWMNKR